MSSSWYCCQCGDGANTSMMSSCPIYGCGHRRCGCCQYSYNNNNYAHSPSQQHAAPLSKGSSSSNLSSSYYTQRPERPKIWRWICCRCGGDNSYKIDQGCATCCNHWRDDKCTLYDASAR
ncbi:hypothetical protein COCSADRAFT_202643 [Bipolaris sorokiniana ND90Pr]|uniref:Uncharacterized protein n=1 Tax=Cochliobolus sativus (strain ND90Pr / ATCC 201652) TaxID=665912 RepID=M2STE5_COCSN|nr:uncharacterized protein COCSADRAFT_202643 [Bipolaris sorokiniana ND90Pr]EMD60366.1 hypothetical protein COCSADRAFT_202643 [Bipolaris sorokiniana ND90Pr]